MERVVIAALVVVVAVAIAFVVERRRPAPPTQGPGFPGPEAVGWSVPAQLNRQDFDRPESPWLVAVFSSTTCESCLRAVEKAKVLASADVAVQEIDVATRKDLHDRYQIEAVPIIVLADAEGVVRASFLGPPSATDLWAAVAEAREAQAQAGEAEGAGT